MPAMQTLMGSYLQQSADMFMGLQQKVEAQTRGFFNALQPGAAQEVGAEEVQGNRSPKPKAKRAGRGKK
jgi:polyhydroxyalkanoate synthesis regulator protein